MWRQSAMLKEFRDKNSYAKLVLIFGFGITISLLISPGGLIQQAFFSLFNQDAQTIYESISEDKITIFSDIAIWLSQAVEPLFLLVSIMIALTSVLMSSFRKFFVVMWLSTALGLSALDVLHLMQSKGFTISVLIENLFANTIGGLLLALIFPAIVWVSEFLVCYANGPMLQRYTISAIGAALIGLASSVMLYLFFAFFLHALPFDARIVTTLSVTGILGTKRPTATQTPSRDDFTLIPTDARMQTIELFVHDNLEVRWNKSQDDTTFSLSLYAVSGCRSGSKLDDIPSEKAIFSQENVSDVRISGDAPTRWLQIKGEQSKIVISDTPNSMFWLDEGTTDSSLKITQLLGDDANVQAKTSGNMAIMMTTALLEREGEGSRLVQRRFSLFVDGQEKAISFAPMVSLPEDGIVECKILSNDVADSSRTEKMQFEEQVIAGTLVHIQRTNEPRGYFNDFDGHYDLHQPSGWLKAPAVELPQLTHRRTGKIDFIQLWGSISEIEIDGSPQEFSRSQRFRGFGDLTASYFKDRRLAIAGKFRAAWLGGERLNQTRWEMLPIEFQAGLGSILLAALYWLAKLIVYAMQLWRENRRLFWANS